MTKRIFDLIFSILVIILISPVLFVVLILVWLQDFKNPFYAPPRVGRYEKDFTLIKVRSMVSGADKTGVDSTASDDNRITGVGKFIRKFKIDELSQFLNVFLGNMSIVGPRPNVRRETDLYTSEEKKLLSVKPGITDFSSIVFSDEGDILEGEANPDLVYNQKIRPWKSRLALLNMEHSSIIMDLKVIFITALAVVNKKKALIVLHNILNSITSDKEIINVAKRTHELPIAPPIGSVEIVTSRNV